MPVRSLRMAATAGIVLATLLGARAGHAAGADAAENLDRALRPAVENLALQISACVPSAPSGPNMVLLIGIPQFNRHVATADRAAINAAVNGIVNEIPGWRANPVELTGVLPPILTGGVDAAERLTRTLRLRDEAPIILSIDTARPTLDTLTLRLMVLGRDGEGRYSCLAPATVDLDAATFAGKPQSPATGLDYHPMGGVLTDAVDRTASEIAKASRLMIAADASTLGGNCILKRGFADMVADHLFSLKSAGLDLGSGGQWPAIFEADREAPVEEGAVRLDVTVRPSTPAPRAAEVVVRLMGPGGELKFQKRYDAAVPTIQAEGCDGTAVVETDEEPPEEETQQAALGDGVEEGEDSRFALFASKSVYRVGEPVEITIIPPVDCSLTIVNADGEGRSCVLVPTPGLDNIRLEAGRPYRFPPRPAVFSFPAAGTERLIALCNATDGAVEAERRMTEPVSCAADGESPEAYETKLLELGVLQLSGPVIRRSITLEVEQ